jgi:hypothetical protein
MAFTSITGQYNIGNVPRQVDPRAIQIFEEVTFGNDPSSYGEIAGLRMLEPMIDEKPMVEGDRIETKYMSLYFTDDAVGTISPTFNEYKRYFEVQRKGWMIKDYDFSIEAMENAIEKKTDLFAMAREKTAIASDLYRKNYIPSNQYTALITGSSLRATVPASGTGQNYEYQFGALRGETVSNLKATKGGSGVRNHWRAIELSTGLTADDINFCKSYIKDYKDYSNRGVVVMANGDTLWEAQNVYSDSMNVDEFIVDGMPASRIAGVTFIENEYIPDDFMLFMDVDMSKIMVKAVSPNPALRGLSIIHENGWESLNSPDQLNGSKLKINRESYSLIGRHKILWLDINATRYNANREMQAGAFVALESYVATLKDSWYRGVNK